MGLFDSKSSIFGAALGVSGAFDKSRKTDKATIPTKLDKYLKETFTEDKILNALGLSKKMIILDENGNATQEMKDKKWVKIDNGELTNEFDILRVPEMYTLYGEGYGAEIQSGGYYREDVAFIGFDVKVDDTYLLMGEDGTVKTNEGYPVLQYIWGKKRAKTK